MATLIKYEMRCKDEECGKRTLILVDQEETATPNICPFCGGESAENTGETSPEE
jgi:hypothetical protein